MPTICLYHERQTDSTPVRRKIMKADQETEAAVLAVMDSWLSSYQKRDIQGLMRLVAPDEDVLLYGTGIDEKRIGPAQYRLQAERDWAQTEALAFDFAARHVSAAGPVAWVAGDGLGQGRVGGQTIAFPLRMTAVLEKRGDNWLIVQSHVSVPAAGQEEGNSVPV
jgi:ketosteroid isomerase-like protein